jgi:hypothetical protein
MARNFYFSEKVRSEINLYEDLMIEALKVYGQDVYYLPRTIVNEDTLFGDDAASQFYSSNKIEMYIENVEGFDGEGDLFTRFGVEIRDEATFIVAKSRWKTQISRGTSTVIQNERPTEGDLIYLPLTKSIFEIRHVEHEQPFYQIENVPIYKMRCTLFEYSGEDLDTGTTIIDDIEKDYAYQYKVCLLTPRNPIFEHQFDSAYSNSGIYDSDYVTIGALNTLTLIDGGTYIQDIQSPRTDPSGGILTFNTGNPNDPAVISVVIDSASGTITSLSIIDSGAGYFPAPELTLNRLALYDSSYSRGDLVSQTLSSGITMNGEVQRYQLDSADDSCRYLYIAHAGASDGEFRSFINSPDKQFQNLMDNSTNGNLSGLKVLSVSEINKLSETEQNNEFTAGYVDDFLDFSEDNPFGDPSAQ